MLYMVTWIPSIYPLYVSINIPAPWILSDIGPHPAVEKPVDRPAKIPRHAVAWEELLSSDETTDVELRHGTRCTIS